MCRAWACWSVAMNSQKGQGMWATGIRLWCWWFWFAIQKHRQYDRLKWFWFAIQKPRSFHDPMVSTWDFGGLQCFCRLCTLGETERSPTSARSPASAETVFRPFHDDPEVRHTQDSPIQLDPDNTIVTLTVISDTESIEEDHEDPHIESESFPPSYTESSNDPVINKLQNTEYVDNDVDVEDVDDDEEGAGAYFVWVRHSDGHTHCELH